MQLNELRAVLADITFQDWEFLTLEKGDGFLLQVRFMAPDNSVENSPLTEQKGRKWYISSHAIPQEVVQTAFKAVEAAVMHELREQFKYKNVALFNPHVSVTALLDAAVNREYR